MRAAAKDLNDLQVILLDSSVAPLPQNDMILNNTLSNFLNSLRSLRKFFSPRRDIYFTSPLERMSALADRRGFNK